MDRYDFLFYLILKVDDGKSKYLKFKYKQRDRDIALGEKPIFR